MTSAGGAATSTSTTSSMTTTTTSVGGGPPDCVGDDDCDGFGGPCFAGVCEAGKCVAVQLPDGSFCDDGQFCNGPNECQNGTCVALGTPCPIIAPGCEFMTCDENIDACVLVPAEGNPCDDGNPCSGDGVCAGGMCLPAPNDCSALNGACQVGVCSPNGCVAQPANEGGPCNDGDPCTSNEACQMGACVGTSSTFVYFSESFDNNAQGWTLGPEWQIGPAMTSSGQTFANPDPSTDHTSSGPDGVAGVAIGGNKALTANHPFQWLESPPFDATADPGPVVLQFFRWLNSDWTPWMDNRVEVFDGMTWVTLWESGMMPVQDSSWVEVTFDLTQFKNPSMRVRFGVAVGDFAGAFIVSSWNIDDVVVANAACQ